MNATYATYEYYATLVQLRYSSLTQLIIVLIVVIISLLPVETPSVYLITLIYLMTYVLI